MIDPTVPVSALMGGLALGLSVVFIAVLLTLGAAVIRRMVAD